MTVPRLDLLGGFRVAITGRAQVRTLTLRQRQLMAFLGLFGRDPLPRQQIAGRLWPDSTDAQALTNLRREWHHLRDSWPTFAALVDATPRTLAWRTGAAPETDVSAFEANAARGLAGERSALEAAAALYRGELLAGWSDEWLQVERARLQSVAVAVLTSLVDLLEREQAHTEGIARARQLLAIDPLNESGWRALMRCHARRGDRAAALHVYQQCAATLKHELDVQPSAATRMAYREIVDLDADAPSNPAPAPALATYPLVGRGREWSTLLQAWRAASAGDRQLAVVRGEAGIGKTRLAEELVDWCRSHHIPVATTRCYAGDGRLAYAPVVAWLRSDAIRPALSALDPLWLTEIARLHPDVLHDRADVPAPESRLESWQRTRLFEALSRAFDAAAPLLLVVDDLQWADAETLEWLHVFLRAADSRRCLVVGTVRTEEEADNAPLVTMLRDLARLDRTLTIDLGPLDETATGLLAEAVAERSLDDDVRAQTFRQTEGHPLFIVERGRMETAAQRPDLSPRVQAVVAERLSRLSDAARDVAGIAAAIGRDFSFDVLAQVTDLEEHDVVRALDELWRRSIVRAQAGDRWDFSHDRIREVAYDTMPPARTRLVHRRIAQALERSFAGDLDPVSAEIAAHLDRGGQSVRAIPFLERAAAFAGAVSANEEAIRCLTHALAILDQTLPGRDRDQRELALRATLSGTLTSARGYAAPEVEENLTRVVDLAAGIGRGEVPVRWLWCLWTVHFMLGDLTAAMRVSEQALGRQAPDVVSRCEAHHAMAGSLTTAGALEAARAHFDAALDAYELQKPLRSALGSDLGVFTHAWYAHTLWLLGDVDGAQSHAAGAIALADQLGDPYSQTLACAYGALTAQLMLDLDAIERRAARVSSLCARYGFAYYGDWAQALLGWVLARRGQAAAGAAQIETTIARLDAQRAHARRPYYLSLFADALVHAGDEDRARSVVDAAIATALRSGEVWWLPELYRQQALLAPPSARGAAIAEALARARAQSSRSLEQRVGASITA